MRAFTHSTSVDAGYSCTAVISLINFPNFIFRPRATIESTGATSIGAFLMKNRTRVSRLLVAACIAGGIAAVSCSRKEESSSASGKSASSSAVATPKLDFSGTLVSYLPQETVGFFLWEGKHPAYQKYLSSQWGAGQSNLNSIFENADEKTKEILDVLTKVGIDPKDPKTWRGMFAEAVAFASKGTGTNEPAIALAFRADATVKVPQVFEGLKKALPADKTTVTDLKLAKGTGVKLMAKDGGPGAHPIFVAWNDNFGVISTAEWVPTSLFASAGNTVPGVVTGPLFEKSIAGLPENSARFGTAYADVRALTEVAEKVGGAAAGEAPKPADIPVQAVSFALGMDDSPRTHARVVYDESKANQNQWFKSLGSSESGTVAAAVPTKPLLFLSIDGQTAKRMRDAAIAAQGDSPAAKMVASQLSFLDSVKRIGLVVRTAPMGQSLLPIPDMMLIFDSSQGAQTSQQVQSLVTAAMGSSGMPPMPWTDSKVNDVPVKSMTSPFGVGMYLASSKNLVFASTTEGQLKAALSGAGFTKSLAPRAEAVFASEQSIGNLYLNFSELASMLESMGGMMAMYAPQDQNAAKFMQPENIEAIRKMGTVVGTLKLENGLIGIDSFYQVQPQA